MKTWEIITDKHGKKWKWSWTAFYEYNKQSIDDLRKYGLDYFIKKNKIQVTKAIFDLYFDIAHYVWHKALNELYRCYRVYTNSFSGALIENGISMSFGDFKENHDINEVLNITTLQDLDIDKIDYINSWHIWSVLNTLWRKESEYCINTSLFFQIMMETIINDTISDLNIESDFKLYLKKNKFKKCFYSKWSFILEKFNADKEKKLFDDYFNNIYKWIRIPTVHPEKRLWLRDIFLLDKLWNWEKELKRLEKEWFNIENINNINRLKEMQDLLNYLDI